MIRFASLSPTTQFEADRIAVRLAAAAVPVPLGDRRLPVREARRRLHVARLGPLLRRLAVTPAVVGGVECVTFAEFARLRAAVEAGCPRRPA